MRKYCILFISEQKVQALVGPIEYVFLHLAQALVSGLAHYNGQLQETTLFFFVTSPSHRVMSGRTLLTANLSTTKHTVNRHTANMDSFLGVPRIDRYLKPTG
jgi:hypothetical protein